MVDKKQENSGKNSPGAPDPLFGWNITVGVLVFSLSGYFFDQKSGGGYKYTLIGFGIGILYLAYEVWKMIKKSNQW